MVVVSTALAVCCIVNIQSVQPGMPSFQQPTHQSSVAPPSPMPIPRMGDQYEPRRSAQTYGQTPYAPMTPPAMRDQPVTRPNPMVPPVAR